MGKLFFIGDSITAGAWDDCGGWVARIMADVMALTIKAEESGGGFYCLPYNLGVSGDTFADAVERIEKEITVRLYEDEPDEAVHIVIALGCNDSVYRVNENRPKFTAQQFHDNVVNLITLCRRFTDKIAFIGLTPVNDALPIPIPRGTS